MIDLEKHGQKEEEVGDNCGVETGDDDVIHNVLIMDNNGDVRRITSLK